MLNKYKIQFWIFKFFARVFRTIGLKNTRKLALFFGNFVYFFVPIRKKTVLKNLHIAFPEKSENELKSLARKNYQNITITFFELMMIPYFTKEEIKSIVKFEDFTTVKEFTELDKGLIVLTGHFGSWEYVVLSLTPHFDKVYNVLVKPQSNPYITEWLEKTRHKFKIKIISTGVSVKEIYKALKNREVVGIAGDQRGPAIEKRFSFFNHPTSFYTGTAEIAVRTDSKVLLVLYARQKDFSYKAYTEILDFSNLPENYEDQINELTKRYISFIEKYVRMYPEQYFWMHKIWKY
jgi:KDO2-lipid IV(A) lauroyltransferase